MKLDKQFRTCGIAMFLIVIGSATVRVHAEQKTQQPQAASKAVAKKEAAEVEGFTLSLKAPKEQYAIDETLDLEVLLTDVSRENFHMPSANECTYTLQILRPDGTLAPLTEQGISRGGGQALGGSVSRYRYSPGRKESISMRSMNAAFDIRQVGDYLMYVSRPIPSEADPKKVVTLMSNIVKIHIEAPKVKDAAMTEEATPVDDSVVVVDAPQAETDEKATP